MSLDIVNAFGTLPYGVAEKALRYHGVPLYLRRFGGSLPIVQKVLHQTKDCHIIARNTVRGMKKKM